jgi:hypothetical protein
MSNRLYASIFYIAFIVGSSWITVSLGEAVAREAFTKLALFPSRDARPSRVDTFLAAQERAGEPREAAADALVPLPPTLTIGALAKAMDEAETSHADPMNVESASADTSPPAPQLPIAAPEAEKPRVAGWIKRLPKRALTVAPPEENSSNIIMRSLRAEM